MANILVIDDDLAVRNSLERCFQDMGHAILLAATLEEGLQHAQSGVDVVYLDLQLPDGDGRAAISQLADTPARPEVIVITGLGHNYGAQETMDGGAWEYIPKPASPRIIKRSLNSALQYRASRQELGHQACPLDDCGLVGRSPAMERATQLLGKAAQSQANVLIQGETGVGKELAARAIHANSSRARGAFVVVDCSTLSESLVESLLYGHVRGAFTGAHSDHKGLMAEAHDGTLFLDEVGELPLALQKSFLRVLQERRFRPVGSARERYSDFRLVAATHRDLAAMCRNGLFRNDLLFRLRTVELPLPPLREREDDISLLADHFLKRACSRYELPAKSISSPLLQVLCHYAWPGNVRELGNAMEAAVIEAGADPILYPKHLPPHLRLSVLGTDPMEDAQISHPPPALPEAIVDYAAYKEGRDKEYFQALMQASGQDVTRASQLSGLSVPSIYRKLSQIGLRPGTRVSRAKR